MNKLFKALKLAHTQGRLKVRQPVVHSKVKHLVVPGPVASLGHVRGLTGNAVCSKAGHALSQLVIIGCGKPALTGRNNFDRVKTKDADIAKSCIA